MICELDSSICILFKGRIGMNMYVLPKIFWTHCNQVEQVNHVQVVCKTPSTLPLLLDRHDRIVFFFSSSDVSNMLKCWYTLPSCPYCLHRYDPSTKEAVLSWRLPEDADVTCNYEVEMKLGSLFGQADSPGIKTSGTARGKAGELLVYRSYIWYTCCMSYEHT